MSDEMINVFGKPLHTYTRAEALEDGVLVDVSEMAQKAGFKIPVAVTHTVWDKYIEWTQEDTDNQTIQDQSGRLWDVLWKLMFVIKIKDPQSDQIICRLDVIPRDSKSHRAKTIELKVLIGDGDEGEPVFTIMLPTED